jgi:hypothetical protein
MKNIKKIRLFSEQDQSYRYPDSSGHFYVHHVNNMIIWDNNKIWIPPWDFNFVPAVVQQFFGEYDDKGQELYQGDIMVWEISCTYLLQHTIWVSSIDVCA